MVSSYTMDQIESNFGLSRGHPTKLCAAGSKRAKKRLGLRETAAQQHSSSRLMPAGLGVNLNKRLMWSSCRLLQKGTNQGNQAQSVAGLPG
ncbi:hypothetical protein D8674_033884 [Pyrus ussuriensis x Pyrus communis]|uniref:Uncharacterized protein n=1 Tax=Pyrus ussuriensis x Pyrus communis TaxID=2448454 RepID=A0A5N5HMC5_9ROSA|nr:hypothetical protein D8674_033884 [Pyrus ussuriensis x Pyrus communis]